MATPTITPIKILWTGGWDSTFRVLYVVLAEHRHVEPHYIIDTGRRTTTDELRAISRIRNAILKLDQEAAGRISSLVLTPHNEVPKDEEISNAWKELRKRVDIARQYDFLARYAQSREITGLELCVEKEGGIYDILREPGDDGGFFERFVFPVLDLSKQDMRTIAIRYGFADILNLSWFCHRPIFGKPCGICAPCISVVKHGLHYRISRAGLIRYHLAQRLRQSPLKPLFRWAWNR